MKSAGTTEKARSQKPIPAAVGLNPFIPFSQSDCVDSMK